MSEYRNKLNEIWTFKSESCGWLTPRQAMAAGLDIKGQKCTQITFWQATTRTEKGDDGTEKEQRGMFCKVYHVLNLDQCEGDKSALQGAIDAPSAPMSRHQLADSIASGLGLTIGHGGDRAFYAPQFDRIQMPTLESFDNEGAYCATLSHEAIHSTGAKSRLDRQFGARFGDHAYAFEELVAELGAAFIGAVTGHSNEVPNHASYLASWIKVLKSDSKAILTAASKAQAAADMVLQALAIETTEEADAA
jgi:antirestriction protein ArdC